MHPLRLLAEAVAVGIGLLVLAFAVHAAFARAVGPRRARTDAGLVAAQVGVAGGLFHVLCEVTGINGWFCAQREGGTASRRRGLG